MAMTLRNASSPLSAWSRSKPHWLRNNVVLFRKPAISSREMPLVTRLPQNGGVGTGTSVATVGATTSLVSGSSMSPPVDLTRRSPTSRPHAGPGSSPFLRAATSSMTRRPLKASLQ